MDLSLALTSTQAYVNLAYCLQTTGQFKKAWNVLTAAIGVDKHNVSVLEARAIVNLQVWRGMYIYAS